MDFYMNTVYILKKILMLSIGYVLGVLSRIWGCYKVCPSVYIPEVMGTIPLLLDTVHGIHYTWVYR